MTNLSEAKSTPMKILSLTGGKGGIGKTTISVNLAVQYAKMKKKVLLFDADLGLANVDVVLGLQPKKTIQDVISGQCELSEVVIEGPHGLKIIPAGSGVQSLAELNSAHVSHLIQSFSTITADIDVMIIDMASGISNQVIDFTQASQDILVVICNNPSSLMDSYAVIKILHQKYNRNRFGIIVNKVYNAHEGFEVFGKFQDAITKFMNVNLNFLGCVPQDECIHLSALDRVSVVDKYPASISTQAFEKMSRGILQWSDHSPLTGGIQFFFERLIGEHV
jgi:flagellar biosynthesis protein FlhG